MADSANSPRPSLTPNADGTPPRSRRPRRASSLFARGEPLIWSTGGALVFCLAMVLCLVVLVATKGLAAFWPDRIEQLTLTDGSTWWGEIWDEETYRIGTDAWEALPADQRALVRPDEDLRRTKLRTGNFELLRDHFFWFPEHRIASRMRPEWAVAIERVEWGRFFGEPVAFLEGDRRTAEGAEASWARYEALFEGVVERREAIRELERDGLGPLNHREKRQVWEVRQAEIDHGTGSAEHRAAQTTLDALKASLQSRRDALQAEIAVLRARNAELRLLLRVADGREVELTLDQIVRAYPANRIGFVERVGIYLSRWWEFLWNDPREANTEGGVWPALFGTIVMTLLMTLLVVPFGVLAALYLREVAKQGLVVSLVRIAVGNLAGVPSIVFGVFGLGFFCYLVGGFIDSSLFEARLPEPTFGKGGLLWASLTLALLTLPVVVVATEEALAAVPNSMREGSYAVGASKWQTIRRIVLPQAAPGIMTGVILAIARGAGEVAPLMLVGAVKLAPELPVDADFPYVHPDRSFMHLGFHVFDLAFQSQNSEAARPLVYATTLLLIAIVVLLNVVAIRIRSRLRRAKEIGTP